MKKTEIKKELDVDFIKSQPLSQEESDALSTLISESKAKYRQSKSKAA